MSCQTFKIYERLLFKQMTEYFNTFISKHQCRFKKTSRAQFCFASLQENGRKFAVDNKKVVSHDLIMAKLNACGFNMTAFRFMHNYLTIRKQQTRINSVYSSWEEIFSSKVNSWSFSVEHIPV